MIEFAQRLLAEWKRLELPVADAHVLLAVSGGADSTAMLLACEALTAAGRLAVKLSVAHLDHGLREEAGKEDAQRVSKLAKRLGFDVTIGRANVAERASETGDNLEQAARRARYEFLRDTARRRGAQIVLTAHTLDDQAETVLLRLLRGSGAEGLGGIPPTRSINDDGKGHVLVARPLLHWARRADTERYCESRGVEVCFDEMNWDMKFARVRVRRTLLPLLESFNPSVVEALSRTAELLRDDAEALEELAGRLLTRATGVKALENSLLQTGRKRGARETEPEVFDATVPWPLRVPVLLEASPAVLRRALRMWISLGRGDLRRLELVHVKGVERLLSGARGGRLAELPGGSRVERRRGWLVFHRAAQGNELKKQ